MERHGLGCGAGRQHCTASGGTVRTFQVRRGVKTRLVVGVLGRQFGVVTMRDAMFGQPAADECSNSHTKRRGCSKQQPRHQPKAASTTEGRHHYNKAPNCRGVQPTHQTAHVASTIVPLDSYTN